MATVAFPYKVGGVIPFVVPLNHNPVPPTPPMLDTVVVAMPEPCVDDPPVEPPVEPPVIVQLPQLPVPRQIMHDPRVEISTAFRTFLELLSARAGRAISGGGGSIDIPVYDEGVPLTTGLRLLDITGDGAQAFDHGGGSIEINVPGGAGSAPPFPDDQTIIKGAIDASKLLRFDVESELSSDTTVVLKVPWQAITDMTIAVLEIAQKFTGNQSVWSTTLPIEFSAGDVAYYDLSAAESNNFNITLTSNASFLNPLPHLTDGMHLLIVITQDSVGGWTMTFPTQFHFPGGVAPVITQNPGARDTISCYYQVGTSNLICTHRANFLAAPTPSTWDPAFKGSNLVLSGGNRTVTRSTAGSTDSTRSTTFRTAGRWYFEAEHNTAPGGSYTVVGVCTPSYTASGTQVGAGYTSAGVLVSGNKYYGGDSEAYGSAFAAGDIAMCAFDMNLGRVWFGKNGSWFAGGNPAAGTGYAYSSMVGKWYAATSPSTNVLISRFAAVQQTYLPPAGFEAWDR